MKRTKKHIANMLVLCMIMSMFGFGSFGISYAEPVAKAPEVPADGGNDQTDENSIDTEVDGKEVIKDTGEEEGSPLQESEEKSDPEVSVPKTTIEEKPKVEDEQNSESLAEPEENSGEVTRDTDGEESSGSQASEAKPNEEASVPEAPAEEKPEGDDEQPNENPVDPEENGEEEPSEGGEEATPKETVPGVPTEVSVAARDKQVAVSFTAPEDNGGAEITGYTVISSPGGITKKGDSSPIIVTGLTNGTEYTFTVKATNSVGDSNESEASEAVTPQEINPNVRHALKEGNVFLGGKYIELGISPMGYFGTTVAAPDGFHPIGYGNRLGMQVDGDGFDNGKESTTGDFFLPGSPVEGFGLGYKLTKEAEPLVLKNYNSGSPQNDINDISIVDGSSGNILEAISIGTTEDKKLKITQKVWFEVNDTFFNNEVTVENLSDSTLYDVRYTRSVDPDQDADKHNRYDTKNSVIKNPPKASTAVVIAKGAVTDEPFIYMAKDNSARAAIASAPILDPYSNNLWVEDGDALITEESTNDTNIHLTFKIGDIPAGETKTVTMYSSLNPDLDDALNDLGVEEKSSNANLSALNIEDKELTPKFASNTTSYVLGVDHNTRTIKITPTVEDKNATIKVNGAAVNSGDTSDDISLSYGKNVIQIVVTAQDETTTKTYTLEVSRSNPPSHKSKHKSKSTPGATVIVNGVSQTAGTSKENRVDGLLVAKVDVNEKVLNDKIDSILKNKKSTDSIDNLVEVPVTSKNADKLTVEFTGDVVKKLDDNKFKLSVQADNIDYIVPAKEIDIENIAELLDVKKKNLDDIKLDIKIDKVDEKLAKEIMKNAENQNYKIVFPPVDFTIVAKTSKKEVKISKFSNYVNRVMEIPGGIDPKKITTGIVYNKDGTFSHVPTEIFKKNGKYYAKLNSLTNSSYSVIGNPITVDSVEKHWSKAYVNDMASRLVVKNPEDFVPDAHITRGDFAEYITKALGLYRTGVAEEGKFKDVEVRDGLADAITIATEYGIINGYPDKTFRPDAEITREEAMVMYARAMDIVKLNEIDDNIITIYQDQDQISKWAYEFVEKTIGAGVFNGRTKDTIVPQGTLTYAEAATAIRNLLVESGLIND
ncbi:MAG: S-layer homology domain-containing protein [Maledivibacter sp.]|jgi:hypothetical protein|nr:S-layer homology domain-containing protein [Maledivibacter sp.]